MRYPSKKMPYCKYTCWLSKKVENYTYDTTAISHFLIIMSNPCRVNC